MKKINVYFIGECIIIILLLAILGLLISDKGTLADSRIIKEISVTEQSAEAHEMVVGSMTSGIQNVTEVIGRGEIAGQENYADVAEEETVTDMLTESEKSSSVLQGKNIVVFGDSIWDDARGEDGISEQLMALTGCTVYNCAIGGTSAALIGDNPEDIRNWDNQSFNGMVYVANDVVSAEKVLGNTAAYEVMEQVEFNKVDYVLISYGLNDFFSDVPVYPEFYYDINSYIGALRNGILHFREHYPQAQIVLVTPTYSQMYEDEREYRIGDYVEGMRSVSVEMNTGLADMFHIMGDDASSRLSHLDDGVHLSSEGRSTYARGIAWYLTKLEKENQQM